jgi:ERCC4-related helicase
MENRPPTTKELQRNLQVLAQVCQQNFQTMSNNDRVLIDMSVTNTINVNAIMSYLESQGVDLKPFIEVELKKREEVMKAAKEKEDLLKSKEESIKEQMNAALKKAAEEAGAPAPQPEQEKPLEFGGDFKEEKDVVGTDS